jgi:hypothetical protein
MIESLLVRENVCALALKRVCRSCAWGHTCTQAITAKQYPWVLPNKHDEVGAEGAAFPRRDDFSKYSVTGLEMALAHFRFPHAAECFFFMRKRGFMDQPTWNDLPLSARVAFQDISSSSDAPPTARTPTLGPKDSFSPHFLRALIEDKQMGAGRVRTYDPKLNTAAPYAFRCLLQGLGFDVFVLELTKLRWIVACTCICTCILWAFLSPLGGSPRFIGHLRLRRLRM